MTAPTDTAGPLAPPSVPAALSSRAVGKRGAYARATALDDETNKELLLKHIRENQDEGSPLADLMAVVPALSKRQVPRLLVTLREDYRVHLVGRGAPARWHPGAAP